VITAAEARARLRELRRAEGRMLAVLDDDPTGSQSVHRVQVVTVFESEEYAQALAADGATAFILTNTRGMPEAEAVALTRRIADDLFAVSTRTGPPVDVLSRGDSTLRGHVLPEVRAIDAARRRALGRGYDAILLAPAFFEAGRTTLDDVHRVRIGGVDVPAGETEFARDATFGYRSSNLREFLAEKSEGEITAGDVHSLTLADIREGGPEVIADRLLAVSGGSFVIVNALTPDDYDLVALGVALAQQRGAAILSRGGPSFARALAGIEPVAPLSREAIPRRAGHGLIVVGSHVSGTSAQVDALRAARPVVTVELDARAVLGPGRRSHVAQCARAVTAGLRTGTVLLVTSRDVVTGDDPGASLKIARSVSSALVEVAAEAVGAQPAWVIAKGGITSHEVAVDALGLRRAEVRGQLGPGIISLLVPIIARPEAVGMPFVVFAGNVGDASALADVVARLEGG
jgi:uncharacterized protein YgbK (DUF1537 family)